MKGQWKQGWLAVAVLVATAAVGSAQTTMAPQGPAGYPAAPQTQTAPVDGRSNRMAVPGTVNYVEGQVMLNGQPLPQRSAVPVVVDPNQVVSTADGYVEVLLTPGAFLRIGHNSEVRFINAGLTGVNVQLDHGSAMIEAADVVKGSSLEVAADRAKTRIEQKGLYAFDADQHSVKVLDGKAVVLESAGETTLKKGDAVFLSSNTPLKKRDFELKAERTDPLYVWSKVRSEDESRANLNLANTIAVNGGWYGPGWYWNPFWADYAFLPGAGLLYSPFGWGYYSPAFAYYGGFYGRGFYGHGVYGRVGGVATVHSFAGGGFHGGGRR